MTYLGRNISEFGKAHTVWAEQEYGITQVTQ